MQSYRPIDQGEVGLRQPVQEGCPCTPGLCRRLYLRFLPGDRRRGRAGIHDDIHHANAGNSVRQTVMDSSHHSGAPALQPRQSEIPERPLSIQTLAHDLPGQRLEFVLRPALECYSSNVVPNVESRIELPTRKAELERNRHHALTIAGNQRKLRFDVCAAVRELYLALEYADPCDIERLTGAFDMQKQCVSPRE